MLKKLLKVQALVRLGPVSIARVAGYRIGLKTGMNPVKRIIAEPVHGTFFNTPEEPRADIAPSKRWEDSALYFGWNEVPVSPMPDWHRNPFNGEYAKQNVPWSKLHDFDSAVGDIKIVWEASRFDWVLSCAQRVASGDEVSQTQLNDWLNSWCENNPPYFGSNWKCGQEASIRVMHLAMASIILQQAKRSSSVLLELIRVHLKRIAPTIQYAVGQDNNHGTSEAAALFIGGSWLALHGVDYGKSWQRMGRKWLENRVARLIEKDGSFSQYSVNYHRVLLDTLSMAEVWRRNLKLPKFSKRFYRKAAAASSWLYTITQAENGDAPNLGANDGARLLPLTDTDYRDYRPAVQLAFALFCNERAYPPEGIWNAPLHCLGIELPDKESDLNQSRVFDDGGYAVIRSGKSMGVIRYPRFRFRPSHADAMHLDLWHNGINILRDGGTFSYNTDQKWLDYFSGTKSHNTIQFDGRNQMPRISRFLFGAWLKMDATDRKSEIGSQWSGAYSDFRKNRHRRTVRVDGSCWQVGDEISGSYSSAVLRWRLAPGKWVLEGSVCKGALATLTISENIPVECLKITEGWESRYYMQKAPLPVLEITIPTGVMSLTTDIDLVG